MWRWSVVVLLVACAHETTPAPPPPPPPLIPASLPPPDAVAAFLAQHAHDREPWRATADRKSLSPADATDLALRLGEQTSYIDGDWGCVGQPVRYELARGAARFEFVEDCGHMMIGTDSHAASFSTAMIAFLRRSRGEQP